MCGTDIEYNNRTHQMITSAPPHLAVLAHHPETPCSLVHRIDVAAGWVERETLSLAYNLRGDASRLCIPPARPPGRADGLWRHTCFEVFIVAPGWPGYFEFNFSPSGEWAAYAFKSYRDGGPIEDGGLEPKVTTRRAVNGLELRATVPLDRLLGKMPPTSLSLGLSAVIEAKDGTLSYWALKHPPGKPDFHHRDSFALELALRDKSA